MAVLPQRPGPHGRVCFFGSSTNVRLSRRRCRLRPLRHGSLYREHWHYDPALPGDVQEELFRRCVAEPVAGLDPAGACKGASKSGSTVRERPDENKDPGAPGLAEEVPTGQVRDGDEA